MWAFWHEPASAGRDPNIGLVTNNLPARRIYCNADGSTLAVGDLLRNPDMGAVLRRVAEHGVADFYEGETAGRNVADMEANGGLLTAADLVTCAPEENEPLWGSYRGQRLATNQPPGGGVQLVQMLNILECFDLVSMGHNSPEYVRVVA
jgi:gamma-glutamyltranspeptidase/glutathione hydrolase